MKDIEFSDEIKKFSIILDAIFDRIAKDIKIIDGNIERKDKKNTKKLTEIDSSISTLKRSISILKKSIDDLTRKVNKVSQHDHGNKPKKKIDVDEFVSELVDMKSSIDEIKKKLKM